MTLRVLVQKKLSELIEVVTIADKTLIGSRLHEYVHFVLRLPEVRRVLRIHEALLQEIQDAKNYTRFKAFFGVTFVN